MGSITLLQKHKVNKNFHVEHSNEVPLRVQCKGRWTCVGSITLNTKYLSVLDGYLYTGQS
jgi:hypothetical protein